MNPHSPQANTHKLLERLWERKKRRCFYKNAFHQNLLIVIECRNVLACDTALPGEIAEKKNLINFNFNTKPSLNETASYFALNAMSETYLTFQKFNDIELANEIAKRLKLYEIPYLIEDNKKFLESALSNYNEPDISIKLKPQDFTKADKALESYYENQLQYVDKNYYLFEFTDEELIEIISKPDEWGHFDYQLAKKILKDKGKAINPAVAELLRTQRNKELAKPNAVHRYWIFTGYFTAIFLSIVGMVIGWTLSYHKKTLPDGQRVYAYVEKDRDHGTRMLLIAIISLIVVVVIRWVYLSEY